MGKSHWILRARQWWGSPHFRIGTRTQIRANKGYRPAQFESLGKALEFVRWSQGLRASILGEFLNRGCWGQQLQRGWKASKTGNFIFAIEKDAILPSKADQVKLEELLGLPLSRPKQKRLFRRL